VALAEQEAVLDAPDSAEQRVMCRPALCQGR
jgi:hypothetical protein